MVRIRDLSKDDIWLEWFFSYRYHLLKEANPFGLASINSAEKFGLYQLLGYL